jgi:hypothetical protein
MTLLALGDLGLGSYSEYNFSHEEIKANQLPKVINELEE